MRDCNINWQQYNSCQNTTYGTYKYRTYCTECGSDLTEKDDITPAAPKKRLFRNNPKFCVVHLVSYFKFKNIPNLRSKIRQRTYNIIEQTTTAVLIINYVGFLVRRSGCVFVISIQGENSGSKCLNN